MSSEAATTPIKVKPYIRLGTPADLEQLVDVGFRAFINDSVFNYFGNVKKMLEADVDTKACANRRKFLAFMTKACFLVGGRITVVADRAEGSADEKIIAGALWLPPHKRLAAWMIPTVLRAGVISVLRNWGLTGFMRIVFGYQSTCERKTEEIFKKKGIKKSPEDSWYLQLAFTDPDYQGQGFMSLLVREAFSHAPKDTFTLEATSEKSRDQYAHLGFENLTAIKLAHGKSDSRGICASGDDALGFECWAMAKWPST